LDVPLPSKEGFLRQVLGWREFVHHVHGATDGFRSLPMGSIAKVPGDGGYHRWAGRPWRSRRRAGDPDGGTRPSMFGADMPIPLVYWGENPVLPVSTGSSQTSGVKATAITSPG
jgi:deoxyribodipyrimidine photolyase-related protein